MNRRMNTELWCRLTTNNDTGFIEPTCAAAAVTASTGHVDRIWRYTKLSPPKKKMCYSTSENSWVWRNGWHPPTIVDCDKHKKHVEKAMHLMLEKNNRDCLTWTEETKMHSSNAEQQWIHPKRTATNCESLLHEETSQYIALLPVISAMESTVWWIHTQFMVTKQCLLLSSRHFFFSAILLRFHTANVLQKKENQQQNMNNENVCIHISQPQST